MRQRSILILMGLLAGLAAVDVFTGWTLLSLPVVIACLACVAMAVVLGARRLRLLAVCLAAACFIIHLVYSLHIMSEERRWDLLEREKAGKALTAAVSMLDGRFANTSEYAETVAAQDELVRSIRSDGKREMFLSVADAVAGAGWGEGEHGIILSDLGGNILAWAGRLPDFVGERWAGGRDRGLRVSRSTTHYWMEAVASIDPGKDPLGSLTVFRQLDTAYPDMLPYAGVGTLSDELTAMTGYEVSVLMEQELEQAESPAGREEVSGAIKLPDGSVIGTVTVRGRAFADEEVILRDQGLLVASLALLVLIALGTVVLGRHLVGPRFRKATPPRLALLLAMIGAARLGLSPLRDFLNLDALEAFTSLHYATQMPTGILRSPADLAITSFFVFLGVGIVLLARVYHPKTSPSGRRRGGGDSVPLLLLGFVSGLVAFGFILFADKALERVLADSSLMFATLSPFDLSSRFPWSGGPVSGGGSVATPSVSRASHSLCLSHFS
jgi:hypothetical protein